MSDTEDGCAGLSLRCNALCAVAAVTASATGEVMTGDGCDAWELEDGISRGTVEEDDDDKDRDDADDDDEADESGADVADFMAASPAAMTSYSRMENRFAIIICTRTH